MSSRGLVSVSSQGVNHLECGRCIAKHRGDERDAFLAGWVLLDDQLVCAECAQEVSRVRDAFQPRPRRRVGQ